VYETYQLVLRCGLHWKAWASKKRQTRGGPKPIGDLRDGKGRITSKSDNSTKMEENRGHSLNSTPRFPASLFNTPREASDAHMV
jgi:hypothetical protein